MNHYNKDQRARREGNLRRYYTRKENGLCTCGRKIKNHKTKCPRCMTRMKRIQLVQLEKRIIEHKCIYCGAELDQRERKKSCNKCRDYKRLYNEKLKLLKKLRAINKQLQKHYEVRI